MSPPHFERNPVIEKQLALALARKSCLSVTGFLDLLDEQLAAFNASESLARQRYPSSDLRRTVAKLRQHLPVIKFSDLSAVEREYVDALTAWLQHLDTSLFGPPPANVSISARLSLLVYSCDSAEQLLHKLDDDLWLKRRFPVIARQQNNLILLADRDNRFIVLFSCQAFEHLDTEGNSYLFIHDAQASDEQIAELVTHRCVKALWRDGKEYLRSYSSHCWRALRLIADYQQRMEEYQQQHGLTGDHQDLSRLQSRLQALDHYLLEAPLERPPLIQEKCRKYAQLIRNNLLELHSSRLWHYPHKLESALRQLKTQMRIEVDLLLNQLEIELSLDKAIRFCITEIKSSNPLYLTINREAKSHEMAFGEQNLAAITASVLRGIYRNQPHVQVQSELQLALGRTDITIRNHNLISGHIEFKLVRDKANIAQMTVDAIHQLFERYSENDGIDNRWHLSLYAVIFSHDKRYAEFAEKVYQATEQYAASQQHRLLYQPLESAATENSFTFLLTAPRQHAGLRDKTRTLTVIICNLEIEYQKRRAAVRNKANF